MDSSKHNQTCTLPREEVSKKNKIGMESELENDLVEAFSFGRVFFEVGE